MFAVVWEMIQRDLKLAMRRQAEILTVIFFFVITITLFPMSLQPASEQEALLVRQIAPTIVWVAALLATMLSLPQLFAADYIDGTLEQMLLIPQPLALIVLGKMIAHWIVSGLPLVILSPVLSMQLGLNWTEQFILCASLLLGSPALSFIGAVGAALTLGLRNGGILVSLLILPLYVPVLIFGAGSVEAGTTGFGLESHFAMLAAMSLFGLFFLPWATATALRISLE